MVFLKNIFFKLLSSSSRTLGRVAGYLFRIISPFFQFVDIFADAQYTYRRKKEFASFGNDSIIKRDAFLLGGQRMIIGNNTHIGKHCVLETWIDPTNVFSKGGKLKIGDNCSIGEYTHITSINSVTIGNCLLTGRFVLITDNAHGKSTADDIDIAPLKRNVVSKGEVTIGDNVWIGDKCSIMPGVHIGKGVIVAANSVVTHDVPDYCVVAGIPAKVVKIMK